MPFVVLCTDSKRVTEPSVCQSQMTLGIIPKSTGCGCFMTTMHCFMVGLSVSILTKIGDSSSFGQLTLNLTGDGLRHFALQYQDVAQIALVLLGPNVPVITSPDQLRRDAHLP